MKTKIMQLLQYWLNHPDMSEEEFAEKVITQIAPPNLTSGLADATAQAATIIDYSNALLAWKAYCDYSDEHQAWVGTFKQFCQQQLTVR